MRIEKLRLLGIEVNHPGALEEVAMGRAAYWTMIGKLHDCELSSGRRGGAGGGHFYWRDGDYSRCVSRCLSQGAT